MAPENRDNSSHGSNPSAGDPSGGSSSVPEIMTAQQAAEYLQINTQVLYRYIRDGLIPVARIGKTVRIKKSVLDQWLEKSSWESLTPEGKGAEKEGEGGEQ
jgi:excisionase family DNA binding protein